MKRTTKTIMAFLTAMTITSGTMGVTAYAEESNKSISVTDSKSESLYKYAELKAMSDEELLNVYYKNDTKTTRVKNSGSWIDMMSPEFGSECKSLDEFCVNLAYMVLNSEYDGTGETGIDLVIFTESSTSKYIPGKTEKAINELFEGAEGFKVLTPAYLKETGSFGSNRCIVRADDKKFSMCSAEDFKSEEIRKSIAENSDLRDIAVAYICASQLGFIAQNQKGLYSSGEEQPAQNIATLKGDADLNGEVSLSDVVVIAQYNLNHESFPLKNEVAEANADMNGDGVVDGLDTSSLIENQLGKKDIE